MKVRDAMAKTITKAKTNDTLRDVARKMKQENSGFIPVVEGDEKLVGVITDRDIVIRCLAEGHDLASETVEHVMSVEVQTISPEDDLEKAARKMDQAEVRRLPVVEGGRLVGVLSHGNLVQATGGKGAAEKATVGVTRGA
ncbi:MAG: CBS domain-containing protein [Chloroflexi bacterium]|nr:MAG: CBS domain-containing protein [Chloroflexota bacterium]